MVTGTGQALVKYWSSTGTGQVLALVKHYSEVNGKVKGSGWTVTYNLGIVRFSWTQNQVVNDRMTGTKRGWGIGVTTHSTKPRAACTAVTVEGAMHQAEGRSWPQHPEVHAVVSEHIQLQGVTHIGYFYQGKLTVISGLVQHEGGGD